MIKKNILFITVVITTLILQWDDCDINFITMIMQWDDCDLNVNDNEDAADYRVSTLGRLLLS